MTTTDPDFLEALKLLPRFVARANAARIHDACEGDGLRFGEILADTLETWAEAGAPKEPVPVPLASELDGIPTGVQQVLGVCLCALRWRYGPSMHPTDRRELS